MTVYEKNLSALKKHGDAVPTLLDKTETCAEFELLESRDSHLTAVVSGKSLHSRHAPIREAERIVASLPEERVGFLVCLGLGFGYVADVFLQTTEDVPVYIVIPDAALFKGVIQSADLSGIIENPRVTLIFEPEPEDVIRIISAEGGKKFTLLPLQGILQLYPDRCRNIISALDYYRNKNQVNTNTLIRFGETWVRNFINNMETLSVSGDIGALKGKYGPIPKLVLAAGPSLDEIKPYLDEFRMRCIVIAVDTTAMYCVRQKIIPDFLVVVDPQYWNTRHLDGFSIGNLQPERERSPAPGPLIVSEPSTHPRIFRLCREKVFMGGSIFPIGEFLEQYMEKRDILGTGGSVATTAWDFARYLGNGPVYCAGLDLGFPDKQTHFRGSFFENRMHYLSNRLLPGESMSFSYLLGGGPYYVSSNDGGKVLTDKRLSVYAKWFEQQIRLRPLPKTFTLSKQGHSISGMSLVGIREILKLPVKRQNIDFLTAECISYRLEAPSPSAETGERQSEKIIGAFRDLRKELETLKLTAERGMELSRSLMSALSEKNGEEEITRVLSALEDLDKSILSSPIKEIAGFLLQKVGREVSETGSGAENSLKLYSALYNSAEYHLELITRRLSRRSN